MLLLLLGGGGGGGNSKLLFPCRLDSLFTLKCSINEEINFYFVYFKAVNVHTLTS